jgi:pyruvate formate lyase activating enzyme
VKANSPQQVRLDETIGHVFSVQRYSIHDGPGIRTSVFLKGCPLSCTWCHNPESRDSEPEIWMLQGHCIRCGSCLTVCPQQEEITARNGDQDSTRVEDALSEPPVLDSKLCIRCGSCVEVCPSGARQQVGRKVTVPELLEEILRDRPFFDQSGGGVTFSGGEPLAQYEFLKVMLHASRARGLHTAVDTCGYAPQEHLLKLVATTDLFLYDLKLMDDRRHRDQTGVSVQPILDNLIALDATGAEIWIRLPLVPAINDDRENLTAVARFVSDLDHTRRVHLLPYHAAGAEKQARLGRADTQPPGGRPSDRAHEQAAAWLCEFGLDVHRGG